MTGKAEKEAGIAAARADHARILARAGAVACVVTVGVVVIFNYLYPMPHLISDLFEHLHVFHVASGYHSHAGSLLDWALYAASLGMGPVYLFVCSPRVRKPGTYRTLGLILLLLLGLAGLIPLLCRLAFGSSPAWPATHGAFALFSLGLFVMGLSLLRLRRLTPDYRWFILGLIPPAVASFLAVEQILACWEANHNSAEQIIHMAIGGGALTTLVGWWLWGYCTISHRYRRKAAAKDSTI